MGLMIRKGQYNMIEAMMDFESSIFTTVKKKIYILKVVNLSHSASKK